MNNLKFLSLIGYAPTILKPEVKNNYVVRSLNPVTYSRSTAGNGVTLFTILPKQPFPANLLQVRKPLSSFYPSYNPFFPSLPELIPALFLLTLLVIPVRGFAKPLTVQSVRLERARAGSNPRFTLFTPTKCRETECVSPFALLVKKGLAKGVGKKGFRAGQRGQLKRDFVKVAGVRKRISWLVQVSKLRLTGPLNALNAFTRSLRKRISYLTLMVQFNCLIFLIKKIVKKHIANQSVNVLIKKLNLLILTFFKYIGSLSVDFWKVANFCSILPYTGPTTITVGKLPGTKSLFTYPSLLFTPRALCFYPELLPPSVVKGGGKNRVRLPTLCPRSGQWGEGVKAFTPFRGFEGRDNFGYKGDKQRVLQAKRADISLLFCSIKSFKNLILAFSRYLKLYLYKILWKWVQKRDIKLSQITLINKYWIFIQNNAKFYTLKQ